MFSLLFGKSCVKNILKLRSFSELTKGGVSLGSNSSNPTISIFLGNLPYSLTSDEFKKLVKSRGITSPYSHELILNKRGSFKGFAFLRFKTTAAATSAMQAFSNCVLEGKKVNVNYATAPTQNGLKIGSRNLTHELLVGNLPEGYAQKDMCKLIEKEISADSPYQIKFSKPDFASKVVCHVIFGNKADMVKVFQKWQGLVIKGQLVSVEHGDVQENRLFMDGNVDTRTAGPTSNRNDRSEPATPERPPRHILTDSERLKKFNRNNTLHTIFANTKAFPRVHARTTQDAEGDDDQEQVVENANEEYEKLTGDRLQ